MSSAFPPIPPGNGKHPVSFVLLAANDLKASTAFYSKLFGWQIQALSSFALLTPAIFPSFHWSDRRPSCSR